MAARLTTQRRRQVFKTLAHRDGKQCRRCGAGHRTIWRPAGIFSTSGPDGHRYTRVNPSSNLEIEHILPLSHGGTNDISNLQLLCIDCHKLKTGSERTSRGRSS